MLQVLTTLNQASDWHEAKLYLIKMRYPMALSILSQPIQLILLFPCTLNSQTAASC